jgi:hypothetical protein
MAYYLFTILADLVVLAKHASHIASTEKDIANPLAS